MLTITLFVLSTLLLYLGSAWIWRIIYSSHFMAFHSLKLNFLRYNTSLAKYFDHILEFLDCIFTVPFSIAQILRNR